MGSCAVFALAGHCVPLQQDAQGAVNLRHCRGEEAHGYQGYATRVGRAVLLSCCVADFPVSSFCHVETLELLHMPKLGAAHVTDCLARFFPMVGSFTLKGETAITPAALMELLDMWPRLHTLVLNERTRLYAPLSTILSQRFNAPLRSITLEGFALTQLFTEKFLDNIL